MTDAQMAYLAERRKAKEMKQPGEESNTAPTESPGASSQKYNGYGAFLNDGDNDDGLAVSQTKVEDCWKYLTGIGTIGQFLVFRHTKFGTIIELFTESSGGFSLQREQDAQVKYCSALCSMQDEFKAFAPQIVQRLCAGEGARLAQGVSAGAWGAGMVRANRTVFKAKVKGRAGEPEESAELYLTIDGFIFLSAGGFKCIAVKAGEFMPGLTRPEANKLLKDSMQA